MDLFIVGLLVGLLAGTFCGICATVWASPDILADKRSDQRAALDMRTRAARLAWDMQSTQFGGGTAIGNAIQDLPPA